MYEMDTKKIKRIGLFDVLENMDVVITCAVKYLKNKTKTD